MSLLNDNANGNGNIVSQKIWEDKKRKKDLCDPTG